MSSAITTLVIFVLATLAHPAQAATPAPDLDAPVVVLDQSQTSGLATAPVTTTTTTATRAITLTSNATTVAALAAFNILVLLLHVASLRSLGRACQRQSSAWIVAQRRAEVLNLLLDGNGPPGTGTGWQWVLNQLLADAGVAGRVGQGGVLNLTAAPAPCLQVAGADNQTYVLTTQPDELRRVGLLDRRQRVIALDASLHPAARDEAQLLWQHLARERAPDQAPALPRRAEWFLAVVGRE
jgi:hypothetical protein